MVLWLLPPWFSLANETLRCLERKLCLIKTPLGGLLCVQHTSLYKHWIRFIPIVSIAWETSRLWWLLLLFLLHTPPLLHLLSFFSVCMTNSKEIPNCGRPKPAAPPPAFSWQDGSCLTFNHECFARQLGLRESQWGNRRNLIRWGRQRTVKPLHKDPGARPEQHRHDSFTRETTGSHSLSTSGFQSGESGRQTQKL